jgi:hypothetical protein
MPTSVDDRLAGYARSGYSESRMLEAREKGFHGLDESSWQIHSIESRTPILMAGAIWAWAATHDGEPSFAWGWLLGTLVYALMNGAWIFLRPERTE